MRRAGKVAAGCGLALVFWAGATMAIAAALLLWGKGWTSLAHTLGPAAIMAGAATFTIALIVGVVIHVIGGQARNMQQGKAVIERYLERYLADGVLRAPERVLGLTWRVQGTLRRVPVYLDFATTRLRLGMSRYDPSALESPFAITITAIAAKLPVPGVGGTKEITRGLEARFAPMKLVTFGGWLYLYWHLAVTDNRGVITVPADRLVEILEAMVDGVCSLDAASGADH